MYRIVAPVSWTLTASLVFAAASAAPARAGEPARIRLTVRVYECAGLRPRVRDAALAHAAAVLSIASVELTFRVCGPGRAGHPSCNVPLDANEIVVRILESMPPYERGPGEPMGEALVDAERGRGVLASVYLEPIARLAHASRTDGTILLGRVIAHEIAHLVQATTSHDDHGLMRAMWSADDLRWGRSTDWTFSSAAAHDIRARAASSAGGQEYARPVLVQDDIPDVLDGVDM